MLLDDDWEERYEEAIAVLFSVVAQYGEEGGDVSDFVRHCYRQCKESYRLFSYQIINGL